MSVCFYSWTNINVFDAWGNYVGTDPAVEVDCTDGSQAFVDAITLQVYA